MLGMSDASQAAVVREMEAQRSPCAIYCPTAVRVWVRGQEPPPGRLVHYILQDLQVKFEGSGYQFLTKRDSTKGL